MLTSSIFESERMVNFIWQEEHMAHCGLLRNYRFPDSSEAAEDIRGAKLYGVDDEKLGKVEDVIFDHSTGVIRYVVIDTGGWLSSKRFLVPADSLKASVEHSNDFEVGLTKEQIESFSPYNDSKPGVGTRVVRLREALPLEVRAGDASYGHRSEYHPDVQANGRQSGRHDNRKRLVGLGCRIGIGRC
jgi:sporulation protein YlmC with PRC-barrel domain